MASGPSKVSKQHREAIAAALAILAAHPLFAHLGFNPDAAMPEGRAFPADGYARVAVVLKPKTRHGWNQDKQISHHHHIELNDRRRASPEEWANVIAQCTLHIWMGHCDPRHREDTAWCVACELVAMNLLQNLGVGTRPFDLPFAEVALPGRDPREIAAWLRAGGREAIEMFAGHGTAGAGRATWVDLGATEPYTPEMVAYLREGFAGAIRASISAAVEKAGTAARGPAGPKRDPNSLAERTRSWFIAEYPLLAALAAAFEIVEDAAACDQLDIRVAAVDPEQRLIYIQPKFRFTAEQMRFTIAHELLHVGLRHDERRQGRDPFLWNVACDYVINGWLHDMGIGAPPTDDLLFDAELGLERDSAEAVYDRIVGDLRLSRQLKKARTLRGVGVGDMLGERSARWWTGPGTDLDTFYRRALAEGLDLHQRRDRRGLLPGALVEEIRALQQPPVPWDVKLGQWLDAYFPPVEAKRSFARASRRQSSTPDIPRAVYVRPLDLLASRTFGVVLDTSGSMSIGEIARGLGAIASYAMSRDVPLVRVVQCDAGVHDMGYVEPESLAGRVQVRGRGGTVLMPAIARLLAAGDFPKDAPILVITDGICDTLTIGRDHAYLMPEGRRLPFRTRAPVFHFEREEQRRGER